MRRLLLLLTSLFPLLSGLAPAQIVLPHAISDHAVLQRGKPLVFWGEASPGAKITAKFHEQTAQTRADDLGHWSVTLEPETAGGPYSLTLSGDGAPVTVSDLLVGDVWLASGQSNMEFPLNGFTGAPLLHGAEEIAASSNPRLRLLLVPHRSASIPQGDVEAHWTTCTPATAASFSAVAYFFGRALAADQKVPIGLIDTSWGGTPADSWVSMDTLGTDARLLPAFASRAVFARSEEDLPAVLAQEKREDEAAVAAGRAKPKHPWHPDEVAWRAAALFNGMIAPFTRTQLKGFLWYQGEANSDPARAPQYASLLEALIGDWREQFAQGRLPFLYVQISSFYSPGESWGLVRDEQRRALSVADTAMAVSLDVGEAENVHPPDKQTVAARLAAAARNLVYGEPVPYQGPSFQQATRELQGNTMGVRVWFDHADGLTVRGEAEPSGFELAGPDGHFMPATARIEGSTVSVSAAQVTDPRFVRFGWSSVVAHSLYNRDGFPASTFTSGPLALQ